MSKHGKNRNVDNKKISITDPAPDSVTEDSDLIENKSEIEIQSNEDIDIKLEKSAGDITVISKKAVFSDIPCQDKVINDVEALGYTHYESINLGGNEILFRFRKNKAA